ncbi:hypothetical protein CEXT_662831 [Caerostris extrusa]|uniref:Uncharacterized protein n=1 Tax=Caerostris extrusa TaxID=172846 RepID=A0AAV4PRP6_CAEEX|nr:hypothetical protein CEXT_662831 [Caerostris extrusa]
MEHSSRDKEEVSAAHVKSEHKAHLLPRLSHLVNGWDVIKTSWEKGNEEGSQIHSKFKNYTFMQNTKCQGYQIEACVYLSQPWCFKKIWNAQQNMAEAKPSLKSTVSNGSLWDYNKSVASRKSNIQVEIFLEER